MKMTSSTAALWNQRLPYPDKFYWAARKVKENPNPNWSNETKLLFYALHSQALQGPCTGERPNYFDVVARAKWDTWTHLGLMSKMEAMRLYVRTLEEDDKDWLDWPNFREAKADFEAAELSRASRKKKGLLDDGDNDDYDDDADDPVFAKAVAAAKMAGMISSTAAAMQKPSKLPAPPQLLSASTSTSASSTPSASPVTATSDVTNPPVAAQSALTASDTAAIDTASPPPKRGWICIEATADTPAARYRHSACVLGSKMYVFGGVGGSGSRFFNDMRSFDLERRVWLPNMVVNASPPPRCSHGMFAVGQKVFVFGGQWYHVYFNDTYVFDVVNSAWSSLECSGSAPAPRGGHTVSLLRDGRHVAVFGGEGEGSVLFNDVYLLDFKERVWKKAQVKGRRPSERKDHSAVVLGSRLYIFGGNTRYAVLNDFWYLDLDRLVWTEMLHSSSSSPSSSLPSSVSFSSSSSQSSSASASAASSTSALLSAAARIPLTSTTYSGPTPVGRAGHCALGLSTQMYMFGGGNGSAGLDDFLIFDSIKSVWNVWVTPVDTSGATGTSASNSNGSNDSHSNSGGDGGDGNGNGNGGNGGDRGGSADSATARRKPPAAAAATHPTAREGAAAVIYSTTMFVFGGYNGKYLNTLYMSDLEELGLSSEVRQEEFRKLKLQNSQLIKELAQIKAENEKLLSTVGSLQQRLSDGAALIVDLQNSIMQAEKSSSGSGGGSYLSPYTWLGGLLGLIGLGPSASSSATVGDVEEGGQRKNVPFAKIKMDE